MFDAAETANAASVALFEGGKVLLIQRALAPWQGAWSLPGGRVEPGEDAEACAIRELGEELGLVVSALRPVLRMRLGAGTSFVLQVFATSRFAGTPAPNPEISGHRWVVPDALEGIETTPHLGEVLQRAVRVMEQC